jgi:parvulin-like peptidyl-prolyl isomerase
MQLQQSLEINEPILRINQQDLTAVDLLVILSQQGLMGAVAQAVIIQEAIAKYIPNLEEQTQAYEKLRQKYQLNTEENYGAWLQEKGLTSAQFYQLAIKTWQIENFKRERWGLKIPTYFLERKSQLDRVVYSLIRTQEQELALELYCRLYEGENTFAELAGRYSEGEEVHTQGLIGPLPLGEIPPQIAQKLQSSKPGQLLAPMPIESWWVIIRLEKLLPVHLDTVMEQRLLEELFTHWLAEQLQQSEISLLAVGRYQNF